MILYVFVGALSLVRLSFRSLARSLARSQEDTIDQVISAINAVEVIRAQSVEMYIDVSNATHPQPSQRLIVQS